MSLNSVSSRGLLQSGKPYQHQWWKLPIWQHWSWNTTGFLCNTSNRARSQIQLMSNSCNRSGSSLTNRLSCRSTIVRYYVDWQLPALTLDNLHGFCCLFVFAVWYLWVMWPIILYKKNNNKKQKKLVKSLVITVLHCETLILLTDSEKGIRAFQIKCLRKPPHLQLGAQDQQQGVEQDQLPCGSTWTSSGNCKDMKPHKIMWFRYVTHHNCLSKATV